MAVRFLLNGKPVALDSVDPHRSLLHFLREAGWTGTKEACAEGECGACAVAIAGHDAHGRACFTPVNSCLLPVAAVDGESILSVEGVAAPDGQLHPVQRAMVASGGSQCGYCTPGFVISLFCEYYRPGRTGYDPESISGNLCRCTGYRPIAELARALPQPAPGDPHVAWLAEQRRTPRGFQHESHAAVFARPEHASELFEMQQRWPGARVIAGGTDLMVEVNQRQARWPALISLDALAELKRFESNADQIVLGAGIALGELAQRLEHAAAGDVAALAQLWPLFSSRLIRNRATLGGNLATASPIGDSAPVLLALEAQLSLLGPRGERRIALCDFFLGYRRTALEPGELIASIHLPRPLPAIQRFYKVSKRVLDDISGIAAAFALDLSPRQASADSGERRVERLRVAYGGIAATPLRAHAIEQLATGMPWNRATLAQLVAESQRLGTPLSDHRASAAYRRAMIGRLLEKFYEDTHAEPGRA